MHAQEFMRVMVAGSEQALEFVLGQYHGGIMFGDQRKLRLIARKPPQCKRFWPIGGGEPAGLK
jgi:hypothetical protein